MISVFKKALDFVICLCIIISSTVTGGKADGMIKTISANIIRGILSGELGVTVSSDISDPDRIVEILKYDKKGNAFFDDIDYDDLSRTSWSPSKHIGRTLKLAICFTKEENTGKKELYKQATLSLIDFWIASDCQSDNWWFNKLSNPNALGEIGILMQDYLSRSELYGLAELISRGCFTVNHQVRKHTGANAIDIAMSSIKFGVLTGSRLAIRDAVKIVSKELNYSDSEGLKSDNTFFQHGNRIYMGGYGITFISGMTKLIYILDGTEYNFKKEQLEKFAGFILDGLQIMSFGNTLDPTTIGRSVSRVNSGKLGGITGSLIMLANSEQMPRKDELLAYAESIRNNTKKDYGLHYFDESEFLVINNSDFYFSFRGGRNDLVYSEIINDENVLSYNSSFPGVTTVMHTGDEYYNIAPVLDYSYIPGTTAVYETDGELLAHEDYTYRNLEGTYGGFEKNGKAVCFASTEHEGIGMTVACFATDNAAFLLGAGMKDSKGREMNTTIDQCFVADDFTINGNEIVHNRIKYTIIDGGEVSVESEHRNGNWARNNLPVKDLAAEGDVLTISLKNKGSYAYSVMSVNTDACAEIISNTESLQAIKLPDGNVAAVFYQSGSFEYNGVTYSGTAGNAYIY